VLQKLEVDKAHRGGIAGAVAALASDFLAILSAADCAEARGQSRRDGGSQAVRERVGFSSRVLYTRGLAKYGVSSIFDP
jgi:hypothetical protein